MDKTLGISVVLGAALSKGYFKTFESVKQKTARLGREWAKTNKKLAATGDDVFCLVVVQADGLDIGL